MNMVLGAADFMNISSGPVDYFAANAMPDNGFDFWHQQLQAVLGVPNDMEIDFAVEIARHLMPPRGVLGLKPNREKARERASGDYLAPITRRQRRAYTLRESPVN